MKFGMLIAGLSFAVSAFGGVDWYVNNTEGVGSDDYDGLAPAWDGTHGPKFRIQAAVNAASSGNGDVIHIAAGTYGDDQGYVAKADAMGYYNCRVCISKNITIVGAGRGKTILLGKLADTDTKSGSGALPAILIGSAGTNCRISGITFRNCAYNRDNYDSGSVVFFTGSGRGLTDMPWISDCAVENCYSGTGAFACVNVARTIVSDCRTSGSASVGNSANFVHCIFTRNSHGFDNTKPIKDNPLLYKGNYVINCTFARNSSATAVSSAKPVKMYNCVVVESTVNGSIRADNIFNCVSQGGDSGLEATSKGDNVTSRNFQLAAPIFDDYRPVADLTVFNFATVPSVPTTGKLSWLNDVPEEFRLKDVYGDPVVADEDGRICAGAVQTKMYPVAGINSNQLILDGRSPAVPEKPSRYEMFYAMFDEWPRTFKVEAIPDKRAGLYCYSFGSKYNGILRFPEADGSAFLVLEKGHFSESASVRTATQELWVKKSGNDETGDGTEANPYLTIQKAVDQVPNANTSYAIVHVGPGEYADGGRTTPSGTQTNRVTAWQGDAFIAIRSTDGAEKTVIRGKRGASENGLGPDAIRCVQLRNGQSQLQGFTLTDGYGSDDKDSTSAGGGTAFYGGGERTFITDCVISNCYCILGQMIVYNCSLVRCLVAQNGADKPLRPTALVHTVTAVNSVFVDNSAELSLAANAVAVHCTFYEPLKNTMALPSAHGYLANCLVGASYGTSASTSKKKMLGSVFFADFGYNATDGVNVEGVNFVKKAPCFVDAAGRDLRLVSNSPAIGNAVNAWKPDNADWTDEQLYANYYRWIAKDMEGTDPYFVNGKPTVGAFFKPAAQAVKVVARKGIAVETNVKTEQVGFDEEITVSATPAGRPLAGLVVNGELKKGVTSLSVVPSERGFEPIYEIQAGEPMTWYADAENGDDAKDGWSEATAKKTIKAAFAYIEPGEKVVALPGTYDRESMTYGDDLTLNNVKMTLPARVIVPEGVTVESRDGAEKTFIKGAFAATTTRVGEGAIRCVVLRANSCLRGFTLTGGSTYDEISAANGQGGGVLAALLSAKTSSITCDIEDCVISNNVARYYGGGGSNGNYYRCRFFENAVVGNYGAGGVNEPKLLCDCVIDRNVGNYGAAETYNVINCTFGANNVKSDGTSPAVPLQCDPGQAVWKVYNTLFLGGEWSNVRWAYNCVMPTGYKLGTAQTDPAKFAREDCLNGDVPVDADYRPLLTSAAVGAADPAYRPAAAADLDALGGQRVYNGTLDVGALEADWRPQYAKDIASRMTVTAASPEVTESEGGTVVVPEGKTLAATWKGRPNVETGYTLNFRVSEGGSAEVTVNGVKKTFATGPHAYEFASDQAVCDLTVAATSGSVELLKSRRNLGGLLLVR